MCFGVFALGLRGFVEHTHFKFTHLSLAENNLDVSDKCSMSLVSYK